MAYNLKMFGRSLRGIQQLRAFTVGSVALGSAYTYTAYTASPTTATISSSSSSFPVPPSSSSSSSTVSSSTTTPTIASSSTSSSTPYTSGIAHRYSTDYQKLHPNLTVIDSRAIKVLFTILRDENTMHLDFATAADRLMNLLAEEGLAFLPGTVPKTVNTPCGIYHGLSEVPSHSLCAVSIVRAGDTLLEAVRRIKPGIPVGKILIQRNEHSIDKYPQLFYVKVPNDLQNRTVILVDPMLATGQSATLAIEELLNRGVKEEKIVFLNVVSCPEGISIIGSRFPKVKIITAAVDEGLNQNKYIVPGLGDFGDRYFGTDNR